MTKNYNGSFAKVLGVWFAWCPFGNCFAPAVCLNWSKTGGKAWVSKDGTKCRTAKAILTLRSRNHVETKVYWRGDFRLDIQSGHLARHFGKYVENDWGGIFEWRSKWFGYHCDL